MLLHTPLSLSLNSVLDVEDECLMLIFSAALMAMTVKLRGSYKPWSLSVVVLPV